MVGRKYNSNIKFRKGCLDITASYECPVTRKEVEEALDYYQWRLSEKAGRQIPRKEITVNLREGELQELITGFRVKLGKPLYIGLSNVHQKAPYVLPRLIEDLQKYEKKHKLRKEKSKLIHHAIDGLKEIVNPAR